MVGQLKCYAIWLTVFGMALCTPHNLHRRWVERPVDYIKPPTDQGQKLEEALMTETHITFTDFSQLLTSVKDSDFHACFIFDIDPRRSLTFEEKAELVNTQEPQVMETDEDFNQLMMRAGPAIAAMCKNENIFWLTFESELPSLQVVDKNQPSPLNIKPSSLKHELVSPPSTLPVDIPRSKLGTPSKILAPPKILTQLRENVPHNVNAPPPLSEYKMLMAQKSQDTMESDHKQPPLLPLLTNKGPQPVKTSEDYQAPPPLQQAPPIRRRPVTPFKIPSPQHRSN